MIRYFFSVDVTASIEDVMTSSPKIDIMVDQGGYTDDLGSTVPTIRGRKQVFNIPGNHYTYDNAKAMCQAYDSRLATYQEIEKSYKDGGEWCNYGWSDNQLALFPTQQKTYDILQTVENHENDCGRPGVNGGFIDNKNVRFGVNCFGNKPKMTSEEKELMESSSPYPETRKDMLFDQRVDFWKSRVGQILVSPFNYTSWGQI